MIINNNGYILDLGVFNPYIKDGLINVQKHPTEDLYIYNYSKSAQYEGKWDEPIRIARGLIVRGDGKVIARPFPKFFNLEEHENPELPKIPNIPFDIEEKMDGSLGILYFDSKGKPCLATRGSFNSDQAIKGTEILRYKLGGKRDVFRDGLTYLFEIIYPENRVVINYGDTEDVVALAVIDNKTGEDARFNDIKKDDYYSLVLTELPLVGFKIVRRAGFSNTVLDRDTILKNYGEADNREGFVLHFYNGFRVKVKYDEYVRLHRLITGVTARRIWDMLRHGESLDELKERVPEEFLDWVNKTEADLRSKASWVKDAIVNDYMDIIGKLAKEPKEGDSELGREYRKDFARLALGNRYTPALFNMLDGKEIDDFIWKTIKPKAEKPFREDES